MSEEPTKSASATAKPAPKKPTPRPGAAGKKKTDDRRTFLSALTMSWVMFCAAITAMLLGVARFMFPNVLAEPPSIFTVGAPNQFEPGSVNEQWKNEFEVWIVSLEDEGKLVALSTVCTHLGCTPSWLDADQKFKCPCHGSGFYKNGINFEGPAPRPLERFAISVVDGLVVVDKGRKFQQELGQWSDPASFLEI